MKPVPWTIHFPDSDLEDLRLRLERTRWPGDYGNDDWRYGVPESYLREFVDYWLTRYDWRVHEAEMNSFANYKVEIDDVPIHFIHERGVGPKPMPIVISHGFVPNHWDYRDVIRPLADPASYGGDPADAFDVVVPSIPGVGFSSPLRKVGVGTNATVDIFHTLMHEVLGYERYAAQGCDSGSNITAGLGHKYEDFIIGVHMNMPCLLGRDLGQADIEDYAPEELAWREKTREAMHRGGAVHVTLNQMEPQTAAYPLNDSPAGLAAWILQRRYNNGDTRGNVERRLSKDRLITGVMIYWLTGTFGAAMRRYWEDVRHPWQPVRPDKPVLRVPTGFGVYPAEPVHIPRKLAARETNLVHWSLLPAGGHFAAAEEPKIFVEDIRDCFRKLR